jgi:hypothetical protein
MKGLVGLAPTSPTDLRAVSFLPTKTTMLNPSLKDVEVASQSIGFLWNRHEGPAGTRQQSLRPIMAGTKPEISAAESLVRKQGKLFKRGLVTTGAPLLLNLMIAYFLEVQPFVAIAVGCQLLVFLTHGLSVTGDV